MAGEIVASGRCLCGDVSFEIKGTPVRMAQCHCTDCQRASGTGHMSNAFFKTENVTMSGTAASFPVTADSGNIVTRYFCARCGSRLFTENTGRPGVYGFAVGCLDNTDWFEPTVVVFAKRRPKWDITSTEIPHFDERQPA
jgi:hypothetical protein